MPRPISEICLKSFLMSILALSFSVAEATAARTGAPQKPPQRHEVSNSELIEKLRDAKVTDASFALTATQSGDVVVVKTQQNPKFNENDTKVQGVLIAKTAFDVLPDSIQRTKILFDDPRGIMNELIISRAVIDSYAKGALDDKKLLSSLEIEKKSGEFGAADDQAGTTIEVQKVVAGPAQEERQIMIDRIQYLKNKGANTSKSEAMFQGIEKLAASNDSEGVKSGLKEIRLIVDEQRQALKSAETTQKLGGVIRAGDGSQNKTPSVGRTAGGNTPAKLGTLGAQVGEHVHIKYALEFLGRMHYSLGNEWDELHATGYLSNLPNDEKAVRKALLKLVNDQLASLSAQQQADFRTYERQQNAAAMAAAGKAAQVFNRNDASHPGLLNRTTNNNGVAAPGRRLPASTGGASGQFLQINNYASERAGPVPYNGQ
jgi:hypothetical protein